MNQVGIRERNELNFSWLTKLRWSSIVGQSATIVGVRLVVGIEVPLAALAIVVFLEILSNLGCEYWARREPVIREWHLAAVMALDIGFLTALLFLTGGPLNPFSFLYLVNIALAAVMIHALWTWMLVAVSLLCFGVLPGVDYWPLPFSHLSAGELETIHRIGLSIAFAVTAGFIVHFLWRITGDLGRRETELAEAREAARRQEQMASLATMAAGAAHELATPLGTIALVAKELERGAAGRDADSLEDIRLIRQQVGRCRAILDQMAGGAGKSGEDAIESVIVVELLDEAMTGVRAKPLIEKTVSREAGSMSVEVPPRAFAQAVRNLVTNAQDASPRRAIALSAERVGDALAIEVRDRGVGMSAEVLARCGEPFYSTKAPGAGMGLGLFLARAVVEGLGGDLSIESAPSVGTVVRVTIPVKPGSRAEHPRST